MLLTCFFLLVSYATASNSSVPARQLAGGTNLQFRPLPCSYQCNHRATWVAAGYNYATQPVVIPCGHCITWTEEGYENVTKPVVVRIPLGLEIQGTLRFPNFVRVHIQTPFIRVFGRLIMRTESTVVTDKPNVRITLINNDAIDTSFHPSPENALACTSSSTPQRCHVGKKPIVVAGGRLDIVGLPPKCKTWVTLKDVVKYQRLPVETENSMISICGSPQIVENFSGLSAAEWTSDAIFMTNGSFLVKNRINDAQGATWDLTRIRGCLVPNQTYLLRLRVRSVGSSSPSSCARSADSCIRISTLARFPDGPVGSQKGIEKQTDRRQNGVWLTLFISFSFSEEELAIGALSHRLTVVGGETLDLEIDDVSLSLPPKYSNPNDICAGNLIKNGNAMADHTYPMHVFGGARLSVSSGIFRVDFRSSHLASIATLVEDCLVSGGRYIVSAQVRVKSLVASKMVMTFRLELWSGEITKRVVASCPTSRGNWVQCDSSFLVEDQFEPDQLKSARFAFETEEDVRSPFEVMDWKCEFVESSQPFIIVAEEGVAGCWGRGSEILITSHTTTMESAQVRRLAASPFSLGDGTVRIRLDRWIIPPVTEKDQDQFPVEVALLSRNILFDAVDDKNSRLHGGHLIVMNTPGVVQKIEGVELRNFGRQGELGRYPIHIHQSRNVKGSIVSKNSIRNSNQRCVVIHGSHNVTISDNIAHETSGHCYVLEDGGELDNRFVGNLGASTRAAKFLVRSFETDSSNPSTFWISNPANVFQGNVAAGCESSGFWLELNFSVRSPSSSLPTSDGMVPIRMPLGVFRDNVAHSNGRFGLRTYPNGYDPIDGNGKSTFYGTKLYKNGLAGIFFHNSRNLSVLGGVLADNPTQIDLDRADNILLRSIRIWGHTERFKDIVAVESGVFGKFDHLVGVQLHGFVLDPAYTGSSISNVQFGGFANSLAPYSAVIDVDQTKSSGHFDYWTKIESIQLLGGTRPFAFDFSRATASGVEDILLHDLDGSMSPRPGASEPGIAISNSNEMTSFIDASSCVDVSTRDFLYCSGVCLRTFSFRTSPAETGNVKLLVEDINDGSKSFLYSGHYHYETLGNEDTLDNFRNTRIKKRRIFAAALPVGRYKATFIENGQQIWPTFVEKTEAPAFCQPAPEMSFISLVKPTPVAGSCMELTRNGDLEMSSEQAPYWFHNEAGIKLLQNAGVGGSNAISNSVLNENPDSYIGQFVDTRCLVYKRQYQLLARVKVRNRNGQLVSCGNGNKCPGIQIRFRPPNTPIGFEQAITVADSFSPPAKQNDWNLLHGTYSIDSRVASSPTVAVTVTQGAENTSILIDELSIKIVPRNCNELVFNGDLFQGTFLHWDTDSSSAEIKAHTIAGGKTVLRMSSRASSGDNVFQNIRLNCVAEGSRFLAFAMVRLVVRNSNILVSCDRTRRTGNTACPRFQLQSFLDIGLQTQESYFHNNGHVASLDSGTSSDGWYIMSGIFTGTERDERSERTVLRLGDALQKDIDLVLGKVSITPVQFQCNELLINGNFEMGETAQFWERAIFATQTEVAITSASNGFGRILKVSNRGSNGDGVVQRLDHRCLTAESAWTVSGDMRLVSEVDGSVAECDPSSTLPLTNCPPVRIIGSKNGSQLVDSLFYPDSIRWASSSGVWKQYEVSFQVSRQLAACDEVWFGVRSFNKAWVLMVDNLTLGPSNQ